MSVVVTFQNYLPPSRYDALPWTEVRVEESDECEGTYTQIDVLTLTPLDADPEDPALRSFTTENGTDEDMWYRVVFADADGDTTVPTTPVQHVATTAVPSVGYSTVTELMRILQLSSPTAAQLEAGQRALDAAATEIDSYLAPDAPYAEPFPALVVQVNLERAVEHWKTEQSPFGIIVMGGDTAPGYTSRNSWRRHANTLLPLKTSFGVG